MFDASLYSPLFFSFFCLWGLFVGLQYYNSKGMLQTQRQESALVGWVVALMIAIWLGMRPNSGTYFGDTANYAIIFRAFQPADFVIDFKKEWLWDSLYYITKNLGYDIHFLFTVVSLLYMVTGYAAIRILIPHKPIITLILFCGSLMFFSFATNGLRNGLACHITLLVFVLYFKEQRILAAVIAFLAYSIHHSVGIPLAGFICSLFIYKRPHWSIIIWGLSIVASLLLGNSLTGFIEQFSVDERLQGYTNLEQGGKGVQFSSYGFRWDFLAYSAMPIVLGYYTILKKRITDNWYSVLFSTYCLANAFWVIFIRAAFSNRFAYLSWFMYPIVVAYPLFFFKLWNDQDKKVGQIILAYVGFTAVMQFLYW